MTTVENFRKLVHAYEVKSLANGNLLVELRYINGIPGGLGRMALAEEVRALIDKAMKARKRKQ